MMNAAQNIKLWLDDLRPTPDNSWLWVKTTEEAKAVISGGRVAWISFDNDLGEGQSEGRSLMLWVAEQDLWPVDGLSIHSANPVAVNYMSGVAERYGPYTQISPDRRTFRR